MSEWSASTCDYKYLNRDPDRQVQAVTVHWRAEYTDQGVTASTYGIGSIESGDHIFAESQIVRVTTSIMLEWLFAAKPELKETTDAALLEQWNTLIDPPGAATPPDDV